MLARFSQWRIALQRGTQMLSQWKISGPNWRQEAEFDEYRLGFDFFVTTNDDVRDNQLPLQLCQLQEDSVGCRRWTSTIHLT
jgi:soluble cytochrome b562